MSHISQIEVEINSLADLRSACAMLGAELLSDRKTFCWYGGESECDGAVVVPGALYEVGLRREGSAYKLLWDSFSYGGLEEKLGVGACRLKQAYAVQRIKSETVRRGYRIIETKKDGAIHLQIRIP